MTQDGSQLNASHLLFYLNTLYEFAGGISEQTPGDILKRMVRICLGTFGFTKGIGFLRSAENSTFALVAHEYLGRLTCERISQQLDQTAGEHFEWLCEPIELSSALPLTPFREILVNAGMQIMIGFQIQEQLTACVAFGPTLAGTPLSETQRQLLSALSKHTEIALGNALLHQDLIQENQELKEALHQESWFDGMIGRSPKMQEIYQRIRQLANYPSYSVLICGESGTGKELIARAIHHHSPRASERYLVINCAALPSDLVESELFGYDKGAFTGANRSKAGLFEVASRGTLFLDEIGEMPAATQAKLLRALEQREVMRVGGQTIIPVDTRVIAATNRDLKQAIANGQFREDLLYRFDVQIHTVPLRERKEDIPLLTNTFLEEIASDNQQLAKTISPEALKRLMTYEWPGNVRELKRVLMEAVMVAEGDSIPAETIPLTGNKRQQIAQIGMPLKDSIEAFKRLMISEALRDCDGNRTQAAAQLGISRQNLQNMMRRLRIQIYKSVTA